MLAVPSLRDPTYISLPVAAIFPLGRAAMSDEDPFKSESSTEPSLSSDG